MDISQEDIARLSAMEKFFISSERIGFSQNNQFQQEHSLVSKDKREKFILDIERGDKKRARLKFQNRAGKTIQLARIDIKGRAHRNPPNSPYRPNERLADTHIHLYHEEFGTDIAYLPQDVNGFCIPTKDDDISWLISFIKFCHIINAPEIQSEI